MTGNHPFGAAIIDNVGSTIDHPSNEPARNMGFMEGNEGIGPNP